MGRLRPGPFPSAGAGQKLDQVTRVVTWSSIWATSPRCNKSPGKITLLRPLNSSHGWAQIKRQYVQAHPGEDVTTPEQGQKAIDWFRSWYNTPAADPRAVSERESWKRIFGNPDWQYIEPAAAKFLPGVVQNTSVMPASVKAAADYAPGLPSKSDMGHVNKLRVGQLLDYVIQHHKAERAGPHYDVRFGNKDTGLLSWASPKGVPAPGEKRLAVQQPVHRHGYKDFEGEIPEGYYGKGTVKKHTEGQVLITKVTPESIHFTTAHQRHPERFTLARPKGWDRNWLLMNTTPRTEVPYEKVRYAKVPADQVGALLARDAGGRYGGSQS